MKIDEVLIDTMDRRVALRRQLEGNISQKHRWEIEDEIVALGEIQTQILNTVFP